MYLAFYLLNSHFNVPEDFNLIQDAVNASSYGDTVLVAPGIYPETIEIRITSPQSVGTVSKTHQTQPTKRIVKISEVAVS